MEMKQVFVSHTKKDEEFCDAFDRVCARVGIKAFRSEFEETLTPAWKTIKGAMNKSVALFFLIGKELVNSQDMSDPKWRYTQNWIAYEIGLACQRGIDVWAVCDDVLINFPMPYINNYLTVSLRHRPAFDYLRGILEDYKKGLSFPYPSINPFGKDRGVRCPYDNCKMEFNLHVSLQPGEEIRCPQCLRDMVFSKGHLI
jgi:hypothetical protein